MSTEERLLQVIAQMSAQMRRLERKVDDMSAKLEDGKVQSKDVLLTPSQLMKEFPIITEYFMREHKEKLPRTLKPGSNRWLYSRNGVDSYLHNGKFI